MARDDLQSRIEALDAELGRLRVQVLGANGRSDAERRAEQYRNSLLSVEQMRPDFTSSLKAYKNMVYNSSFEAGTLGGAADYWSGGTISEEAAWYGTYSLKLAPGEVVTQTEPAWVVPSWLQIQRVRVSFWHKVGRLRVELLDETGAVVAAHDYARAADWPEGRRQFTVTPRGDRKVYLRFTNLESAGGQYCYLDAVQLEPDLSGKWPSLYTDGPHSYPGGGGGGGIRSVTLVVAASDAAAQSKAGADFVCDGQFDDEEIQSALDQLTASNGGTVVLTEGTFTLSRGVRLDGSYKALSGQGLATTVRWQAGVNRSPLTPDVTVKAVSGSTMTVGTKLIRLTYRHTRNHALESPATGAVTVAVTVAGQGLEITDGAATWPAMRDGILVYLRAADGQYRRVGEITAPGGSLTVNADASASAPLLSTTVHDYAIRVGDAGTGATAVSGNMISALALDGQLASNPENLLPGGLAAGVAGVKMLSSFNSVVSRVQCVGFGAGIRISGGEIVEVSGCSVYGGRYGYDLPTFGLQAFANLADGQSEYGMRCETTVANTVDVRGMRFEGNIVRGVTDGIGVFLAGDGVPMVVAGNQIEQCQVGLALNDFVGAIAGNVIRSCSFAGVSGYVAGTMHGNAVLQCGYGMQLTTLSYGGAVIDANFVAENLFHGVEVHAEGAAAINNNTIVRNGMHGIWVANGTGLSVCGNVLSGNGSSIDTPDQYAHIAIGGTVSGDTPSRNAVLNNVLRWGTGFPANLWYGVRIESDATETLVSNNDCYNACRTDGVGISDAGSGTVAGAGNRVLLGSWSTVFS